MFWVFCNSCFIKPGQGTKRQFFMTSCSHILCNHCTDQDATECRRCQEPCVLVPCNSQMPDEVKEVFSDVNEKMSLLFKVLDYQEGNRSKLIAHYRNVFNKYNGAKVYVGDLEKKFKIVLQKYESSKTAILQLQAAIDALTKKCQWYKQKLSSFSSAMSPHSQARIQQSPTVSKSMPNLQFTPRRSSSYRKPSGFLSPESTAFPCWSSKSSGRRNSTMFASPSASFTPPPSSFTPPSKTMEQHSLMNKSRTPKF